MLTFVIIFAVIAVVAVILQAVAVTTRRFWLAGLAMPLMFVGGFGFTITGAIWVFTAAVDYVQAGSAAAS